MALSHQAVHRKPARSLVVDSARGRLSRSCYRQIRQVTCRYHEGVLFLHGQLSSYYLKQIAQETVRDLEGVEEIVNYIEVACTRPKCEST